MDTQPPTGGACEDDEAPQRVARLRELGLGEHPEPGLDEFARSMAIAAGTPQLSVLHRFRDPAEAAATLQVRAGDGAAVDWYCDRGRVRSGSREAMASAAYDGWKADMLAGKITLMAAFTSADVAGLSAHSGRQHRL